MEYSIKHNGDFDVSFTEKSLQENITILHINAKKTGEKSKLKFMVRWTIPNIEISTIWTPAKYKAKEIPADWGGFEESCAMSSAPIYVDISYDDTNKQTIACSDAKNTVSIHTGVIEESALLDCVIKISVDYPVSDYETDILIDRRNIPFYQAIEDVRKWWETYKDYAPAKVPDSAFSPVYSTWYSFHQNIDPDEITEECKYFSQLGCRTLIVDDGWQVDNSKRGYDYCGDWQPCTGKVKDMKAFVDAVHETGMKFVLWYSVPYVGAYSKVFEKFKNKMLYKQGPEECQTYVVDPRYPEIREYLIGLYKQAVIDWGLDGFKLDFVDSFKQSDFVAEGMDYVSVYEAVDRLLKDVINELSALKPDILIEFRQSYIGPLMRTFGNMFRSLDCPCDSLTNQLNILSLRMSSGKTAVHSDMVMWNYDEKAEYAAFQLTRVLFSVPQISVRKELLSDRQAKMVKRYLELWNTYRNTIMFGKMLYKGYANNFLYVSARDEKTQVGAVYGGQTAYIENLTDEIVFINSSLDNCIRIKTNDTRSYHCEVFDCCGNKMEQKEIDLNQSTELSDVPVNGSVVLTVKCAVG